MDRPGIRDRFDARVSDAYAEVSAGWEPVVRRAAPVAVAKTPARSLDEVRAAALEPQQGDTPMTPVLRETQAIGEWLRRQNATPSAPIVPEKPATPATPPETNAQRRARIMTGGGTYGGAW